MNPFEETPADHRNRAEIKAALGLPDKTEPSKFANRCLRSQCVGGSELLDAKEWAVGVANGARTALHDPRRSAHAAENQRAVDLAVGFLERLHTVEHALLTALETARGFPPGSITKYLRVRAPGE
jgi:hypothetical protein